MRLSKTWLVVALAALILIVAGILREMNLRPDRKPPRLGVIETMEARHRLAPAEHRIESEVTLRWQRGVGDTLFFLLHRDLELRDARALDGMGGHLTLLASGVQMLPYLNRITGRADTARQVEHLTLYGLPAVAGDTGVQVVFSYGGEIFDDISTAGFSRWEIADETTGLIDERGAFLSPMTGFYPTLPGASLTRYRTELLLPEGWEAVSEGNVVGGSDSTIQFDSVHPLDGMHLVAGPYERASSRAADVEISFVHYPGSEELAGRYLGATGRYIALYDSLLGPYGWERFSVVENFFPTGYGMPTFTLLGSSVLRLPFIVGTSLGHEVAHNWWGNGVYIAEEGGNWCEGLTTYCADYHYKRQEGPGEAKRYRMDVLRDYSEYVVRGDDVDFPLTRFTSRSTAGSRTIGYGKAMMVFHMVEQRTGSTAFWQALREVYDQYRFRHAAWEDFFAGFEETSGQSFDSFHDQWVRRSGAPSLEVEHVIAHGSGEEAWIEFDLRQVQEGEPYTLDLPVRLEYGDGREPTDHLLRGVQGRMYHARVSLEERPTRLLVDPDFHIFRVLAPQEAPATLAAFFAEERPLVRLAGSKADEGARRFAEALLGGGEYEVLEADDALPEGSADRSRLIFAQDPESHRALRRALGRLQAEQVHAEAKGLALLAAVRSENEPGRVDVVVWGASPEALMPLARKLPHYGKYSYLAFASGISIGKGQWVVETSPMIVDLESR